MICQPLWCWRLGHLFEAVANCVEFQQDWMEVSEMRNSSSNVVIELSKKSSKTEYTYPQFCINFATVFKLETPPFDMTTKLQCFLSQGRGMGEQVGGLGEQMVT
jgi:hypothetical protein